MNIAFVGATSYVAQDLIERFLQTDCKLFLFARNPQNIFWLNDKITFGTLNDFKNYEYDVIINCIQTVFIDYEKYDNMIIEYLLKHVDSLYIHFSSGAVYGKNFNKPVTKKTISSIEINNIKEIDYYYINKIYTEAKHRSFANLNIIDIRLFSYFSKYVYLKIYQHYFMNNIVRCLINKTIFKTNSINFIRDFVHPADLFDLIIKCIDIKKLNTFFDVYSIKPTSKFEILSLCEKEFYLQYEFINTIDTENKTGEKNVMYSTNYKAKEIGYTPNYSSLEAIKDQLQKIFT